MAADLITRASRETVVLEARDRAGEHTAGTWAGRMEGALRSGARAAGEVLTRTPQP
jgi:monoamine oxidase